MLDLSHLVFFVFALWEYIFLRNALILIQEKILAEQLFHLFYSLAIFLLLGCLMKHFFEAVLTRSNPVLVTLSIIFFHICQVNLLQMVCIHIPSCFYKVSHSGLLISTFKLDLPSIFDDLSF